MAATIRTLILLGIMVLSNTLCADSIPENVKQKFKELYPTIEKPDWIEGKDYYIAKFKVNELHNEVYFNKNAELLMAAGDIRFEQLPFKARHYLDSLKSNFNLEIIAKLMDAKSEITYQVKGNKFKRKKRSIIYKGANVNFNSRGEHIGTGRCFFTKFPYFYHKVRIKKEKKSAI